MLFGVRYVVSAMKNCFLALDTLYLWWKNAFWC